MLSEEEKEAIEIFNDLINYLEKWNKNLTIVPEDKKYYKTLLNLITKSQKENEEKDKQIDLMADKLVEAHEWFYSEFDNFTKEDFIEYFETKAKKE